MPKTYLYLLKKNKKDIKIIGTIESNKVTAERLNVNILSKFPAKERLDVLEMIDKNKIDWDAWVESVKII